MQDQYVNKVVSSFYLWLDHTILSDGEGYENASSNLYYNEDSQLGGKIPYSSPFKQWGADSSVTSINIPSGVYVSGEFIARGVSGLEIDYDNGRVLFDESVGSGLSDLSGDFAYKDFNVYVVEDFEEEILFEKRYIENSRFDQDIVSGVEPYSYAMPACFISSIELENKPWALGGTDESKTKIRVILVTDDGFNMDACVSLFMNKAHKHIKIFDDIGVTPFNEYGDLKSSLSGDYNYLNTIDENSGHLAYVERVFASKIGGTQEKRNSNMSMAYADFYLSDPRIPN